jgi:hypothetical protein
VGLDGVEIIMRTQETFGTRYPIQAEIAASSASKSAPGITASKIADDIGIS